MIPRRWFRRIRRDHGPDQRLDGPTHRPRASGAVHRRCHPGSESPSASGGSRQGRKPTGRAGGVDPREAARRPDSVRGTRVRLPGGPKSRRHRGRRTEPDQHPSDVAGGGMAPIPRRRLGDGSRCAMSSACRPALATGSPSSWITPSTPRLTVSVNSNHVRD